jgi:hypothetical protein
MRRNNFQVCPTVDGINSRIIYVGIIPEFYLPSEATLLSIRGERSKGSDDIIGSAKTNGRREFQHEQPQGYSKKQ